MDDERVVELETNGGGGVRMQQLPVGYRFYPTDEELVVHYLKRKVHGLPLPASIIPDHNSTTHLLLLHPSHFQITTTPGEGMQKRYFFYNTNSDDKHGQRAVNIASGCGYWKPIEKEKPIVVATSYSHEELGLVLGVRKTLFFCWNLQKKKKKSNRRHYQYQHQRGYGSNTTPKARWFMHQYRLVDSQQVLGGTTWVLCSVFRKRRMMSKKRRVSSSNSSSVSCSSEVTTDDQEVCSK